MGMDMDLDIAVAMEKETCMGLHVLQVPGVTPTLHTVNLD